MARILAVDDDSQVLALVTQILESQGHEVVATSTGAEGVDLATGDAPPDLMICDLNMRDVSGWEVVRRVRAAQADSSMPILALSAFSTAQDRDEAFEAGCSGYFNKPIDPARFVGRISELLI